MNDRALRCLMWTPLPPERSGIADYAYELLGPLSRVTEVVAVARNPAAARVPAGIAVARPGSVAGLPVYQMGNHTDTHSWIYRQALVEPGLVVLHDTSLLDFARGYFGGAHTEEFRREVEYAHGPIWGSRDDLRLAEGLPAFEVDGRPVMDRGTVSMERRLVTASRGVIVHDPFAAERLRARYPGKPIHVVPHGVSARDETGEATGRAALGWGDDHVVFGIFGGIGEVKRVVPAILAFAEVRRRWPAARLVIAGHPDDLAILSQVRQAIAGRGLHDSVHLVLSPATDEFTGLISVVDVVINLRWPTAGETSGVMMRAFGAGRAVITSDLPQHRHYDPEFCWRVPTDSAAEAQALVSLMEKAACWPEEARVAGRKAREVMGRAASWAVVADGYREALESVRTPGVPAAPSPRRVGVNVFADPRATTGLAEAGRRYAVALLDVGADLTFTEFHCGWPNRSVPVPEPLTRVRGGKDHPVDLWLLNLNEFHLIPDHALDRYTIGLWAWELPDVLESSTAELKRLDELWVMSSFTAEAFRTVTDIPIMVVPSVVTGFEGVPADRARFGLPEDGAVVLFSFSASSGDARKNPWGVVEAFRRAFPSGERGSRAHLVIKATDLQRFPAMAEALTEAMADVGGTLINEDLTRPEMDQLLATCDIYLSLHRSEGFGLGMAEAMALGKAVVATGYGGNTDFMPPGSAAMVGYRIREITAADHRYAPEVGHWTRPGHLWAEPDIDQAARWLRRLAASESLRRSMGAAAVRAIHARCDSAVVGAIMVRRLEELATSLPTR